MTLSPGTRLGPYEILSLLGAGGMGEVYRARDTRLGREVAVKVLPSQYSVDKERLRRFEQEARAAGALNHPTILAIYDVGTDEASPYIVSELLEGETLRDRLGGKALPVLKAIAYALQTANGLAAAHEKGVVHRDLKPENLFITKDGRVKILDFGLAKLTCPGVERDQLTQAPTIPAGTNPGVVMGTVGYMSPEQVRGRPADHRSDIFTFGAILYEMLSGKRAFQGESAVEIMNAIVKEEPPELSETNSNTPPALERLVRRCLEKSSEDRFQSARDVAFYLESLSELSGSRAAPLSLVPGRLKIRERLAWIAAAIFFLAALVLAVVHFREMPSEVRSFKFSVLPPEKATFAAALAISPDGRWLAFDGRGSSGKTLLWVRPLDSLDAQPLPGTDDAYLPFWSPDSRFLGFFAEGKLKKIDVSGGSAQTLCDAPAGRGGTWNRDGVIVFAPQFSSALYRVSAVGGMATPVTTFDQSKGSTHRWPHFLPDGRHFIYLALGHQEHSGIYVGSLGSTNAKRLLSGGSSVAYGPPGYLLFTREGTLMAQPFDSKLLQLAGEWFPVAEQMYFHPWMTGHTAFSVSENGVLAYRSGNIHATQLVWFGRGGKQLGSLGPPGGYNEPWLSPDEKKVAVARPDPQTGRNDIWLLELARGISSRFTSDPSEDYTPLWSPDGSRIVFTSDREGHANVFQRPSSGAGNDELILKSNADKLLDDWSLDRRFIIYDTNPKGSIDLWVFPMLGDRKPFPFLQTEFNEGQGRFSPNGRWMAYASDETGRWEVYVRPFPASGDKWQVSTNGGADPSWRRDGNELFYIAVDRKLMAVDVKTDSTFHVGVPRALFEPRVSGLSPFEARNHYVVTADGQRFLINTLVEEGSSPITVVVNWLADLKRK